MAQQSQCSLPAVACQFSSEIRPSQWKITPHGSWCPKGKSSSVLLKHRAILDTEASGRYFPLYASAGWEVLVYYTTYCSTHTVPELILQDPVYTKIEERESDYYLLNRCSATHYFPKPRWSGLTTFGMIWRLAAAAEVSCPLSPWKRTCRSVFRVCLPC